MFRYLLSYVGMKGKVYAKVFAGKSFVLKFQKDINSSKEMTLSGIKDNQGQDRMEGLT